MANYGINGFGRIGRNVLRAMSQADVEKIKGINDLTDTTTLAHLLKWDSVHGKFDGEIGHDEQNIIVRGHKIRIMKERDPGALPWKDMGVDVVMEGTYGLVGPKGMDTAVVATLHDAFKAAMDQPGFVAAIANFHQEARYLSSSEFRAFALGQIEKQRRLVEEIGLRVN